MTTVVLIVCLILSFLLGGVGSNPFYFQGLFVPKGTSRNEKLLKGENGICFPAVIYRSLIDRRAVWRASSQSGNRALSMMEMRVQSSGPSSVVL